MPKKYLSLQATGPSKSGLTRTYSVSSAASKEVIGFIKWYGPWRRYCFFPGTDTVWDSNCLGEIKAYLDECNENYKAGRVVA